MKRAYPIFAALATAALVAAGCGGGGDESSSSSAAGGLYGSGGGSTSEGRYGSAGGSTTTGGGGATVSVASVPGLGRVLVDSNGLTLYDFEKDKASMSACYGPCAASWPPLTTEGAPQESNGANASLIGTTKRRDGTTQVTYAGHPLYTYAGDSKPGDANGNDITQFGGEWYALKPTGEEP